VSQFEYMRPGKKSIPRNRACSSTPPTLTLGQKYGTDRQTDRQADRHLTRLMLYHFAVRRGASESICRYWCVLWWKLEHYGFRDVREDRQTNRQTRSSQ